MSDTARAMNPEEIKGAFSEVCRKNDIYAAQSLVRSILGRADNIRTIRSLSREIRRHQENLEGLHPVKLALLSSFSIGFIKDALIVAGFLDELGIEVYEAGYDQFRQEILNPRSGLYRSNPDVVILAVLGENVAQTLYETPPFDWGSEIENVLAEFQNLLSSFRRQVSTPLLVHNFAPPAFPILGIADPNQKVSQRFLFQSLNKGLAELCQETGSSYLVDYEGLVSRSGSLNWHDNRMRHYVQNPIAPGMFLDLSREYVKFIRALRGGNKKCIVVDLDNTLWGGVVGEEGVGGIALGPVYPGNAFMAFQKVLLGLHSRGILLATASKNNSADVDQVFDQHQFMVLKKDHFSASQIHWGPKSGSIQAIAKQLNIGLDSIVFVDDNPVECDEVSRTLPMVRVVHLPKQPENFPVALLQEGLFDALQVSKEDVERGRLYKQRAQVEQLRDSVDSLEDFYRDLDMELIFERVGEKNLPRTAQLTQKTNQFNVTTIRYAETDIESRISDDDWLLVDVIVRDRFGDHGIVGVIMAEVKGQQMRIETLLLSCRVIGRTVETAMLAFICQFARNRGVRYIDGCVVPTPKNIPVRSIYKDHGFKLVSDGDDKRASWCLDLTSGNVEFPQWFQVSMNLEAESTDLTTTNV